MGTKASTQLEKFFPSETAKEIHVVIPKVWSHYDVFVRGGAIIIKKTTEKAPVIPPEQTSFDL